MREWRPVSAIQAKTHPLYGRGGWLGLFAFALAIGLFVSVALSAVMLLGDMPTDPVSDALRVFIGAFAMSAVVAMTLFISRSPSFRTVTTLLMIVPWPILAAIFYLWLPEEFLLAGAALWLVTIAIWGTYLQRSRRVRVTFEHCVVDEDAVAWNGSPAEPHRPQEPRLMPERSFRPEPQTALEQPEPAATRAVETDPAEECWAQALNEYQNGRKKPGLWARAYAQAQGDEAAAKAHYLRLRADQLFGEYQERTREIIERQRTAQETEDRDRRYESTLTPHQREIRHAIAQADSNTESAFDAMVRLIELLGGTVERKASLTSPGWTVSLAGHHSRFSNDEEFRHWVSASVLPKAKLLLPPVDRHDAA